MTEYYVTDATIVVLVFPLLNWGKFNALSNQCKHLLDDVHKSLFAEFLHLFAKEKQLPRQKKSYLKVCI